MGLDRGERMTCPGQPRVARIGNEGSSQRRVGCCVQIERESTSGGELELVIGKSWKDTCKEDRGLMTL